MKCVNCESTKNLNFVKTFSATSRLDPKLKTDDYEKHGWKYEWEPLEEWTRLELQKLVNDDIDNNKRSGEEYYCNDCFDKLKWSVVE